MIATEGEKRNAEIFGLDPNLIYRSSDLNTICEVDPATADRVEKLLLSRGLGGERPGGVRVGRHILVMLSVYLKTYGMVAMATERAGGQGR
jgi:hypothetical protein